MLDCLDLLTVRVVWRLAESVVESIIAEEEKEKARLAALVKQQGPFQFGGPALKHQGDDF